MTALRSTVARRFGGLLAELPGAPEAEFTFAPTSAEDVAAVLDFASEHGLAVLPWGAGTHQHGDAVDAAIVLGTGGLQGLDWRPDDLTVVAGAGVPVADLEARLAERNQSAVLPETPGAATVGGVVAAGVSGYRRLRFGPTRDRMLEVQVATGDGRLVRGGGQVVKNVTGYDLPRLFTGSYGSSGVITRICLKLWPVGNATATVAVDDPEMALAVAHRPLAVLEAPDGTRVYLSGTAGEVEAQSASLGGSPQPGLAWPEPPSGAVILSIRVPPVAVGEAVRMASPLGRFVAAHGVGEVVVEGDRIGVAGVAELRAWAAAIGGWVVVLTAPPELGLDPWGMQPPALDLQRRIKAAFDPCRVMVPGRLPGAL